MYEPPKDSKDAYWYNAARDVFRTGLFYLLREGKKKNRDIWEFFSQPLQNIQGALYTFCHILQSYEVTLKGVLSHSTSFGTDAYGNITRMNNLMNNMPDRLLAARQELEETQKQLETAKEELNKPFQFDAELAAKSSRLAELDSLLNMDAALNQPDAPENESEPHIQGNEEEHDKPVYTNESAQQIFERELNERAVSAGVRERIVFGTIPNGDKHPMGL